MDQTLILQKRRGMPDFWNFRDWRLFYKLLFASLVIILPALLITGVASTTLSRKAMLDQARITLLSAGRNTSSAIDQYLLSHREDIVMLSKLPEVMSFGANPNDTTAKANALKALTAATAKMNYDSVAIINPSGVVILSSYEPDMGENVSTREYFQPALGGDYFISDPSVSFITSQSYLFYSAPLRDASGNVTGVLRSRLTVDGIWDLVERDKDALGSGTAGILLDANGIRIAHSATKGNRASAVLNLLFRSVAPLSPETAQLIGRSLRMGTTADQPVQVLPLPEVAAMLGQTSDQTFETGADGTNVRHYASLTSLNTKPWHYVLMAPLPVFTSAADRLGSIFVGITLFVTALVLAATYFISRAMARPIVQLTEIADRISLGELDAEINIQRKDEIGALADAVGRMQASLQAAIERLRARRTP
jgi:C4-dicarboxylate-specific signal transduction histidine kinase